MAIGDHPLEGLQSMDNSGVSKIQTGVPVTPEMVEHWSQMRDCDCCHQKLHTMCTLCKENGFSLIAFCSDKTDGSFYTKKNCLETNILSKEYFYQGVHDT